MYESMLAGNRRREDKKVVRSCSSLLLLDRSLSHRHTFCFVADFLMMLIVFGSCDWIGGRLALQNRFMSMAAFAVSQAMSLDRKPDILRTIKFIEEVGRRDPWNTSANFLAAVRGQGTVGVADAGLFSSFLKGATVCDTLLRTSLCVLDCGRYDCDITPRLHCTETLHDFCPVRMNSRCAR